jgi:undecaprenyl-diphosphatase
MNSYVRNLTGVNMTLYVITDWLGLLPIAVALGFAVLGIVQWAQRKSFLKADKSILALGVFYIAVISVYFFFEAIRVNYRPILIDGRLEASYPSSTATLTMCVMLSALLQLKLRVKNAVLRRIITFAISTFTAFTVIARIISGVHWISDIIGAVLFSTGAVMIYCSFSDDGSEDVILR